MLIEFVGASIAYLAFGNAYGRLAWRTYLAAEKNRRASEKRGQPLRWLWLFFPITFRKAKRGSYFDNDILGFAYCRTEESYACAVAFIWPFKMAFNACIQAYYVLGHHAPMAAWRALTLPLRPFAALRERSRLQAENRRKYLKELADSPEGIEAAAEVESIIAARKETPAA